uniref:SH3 domain-binding glutamic acid-rich protein homolog n=1 Tax=Caligus rogercresseyi TaxID=217165 RepID=C1BQ34_CALRO|nr:SH3 domain-binding glutamic acid-rich protein homolog [Caligus rogercresseyi]
MVIKAYISGNSGNKEIVTHQQRIFMILNSLGIENAPVDIAGPGMEEARDYMRANGKKKDGERNVLPPQIFNEEKYCGDYDDFDIANEDDLLEEFLGIPRKVPLNPPSETGAGEEDPSKLPKEEEEAPKPSEEEPEPSKEETPEEHESGLAAAEE